MTTFLWILIGGILMGAISLVGSVTLMLRAATAGQYQRRASTCQSS